MSKSLDTELRDRRRETERKRGQTENEKETETERRQIERQREIPYIVRIHKHIQKERARHRA